MITGYSKRDGLIKIARSRAEEWKTEKIRKDHCSRKPKQGNRTKNYLKKQDNMF